MRDFRKLEVWRDSILFVRDIYVLTEQLPKEEQYGLCSQINRAAISIPSNIAEGCSRRTAKDFARFLDNALGSSFELETQIMLCVIIKYFEKKEIEELLERLSVLQKRINALRSAVLKTKDQ